MEELRRAALEDGSKAAGDGGRGRIEDEFE